MTVVVAIDPGITGAVAAICSAEGRVSDVAVWDIPTVLKEGKHRVKRMVDAKQLAAIMDAVNERDPDIHVVIESVASMTAQGVATVFSLGDTFGCIRGVVQAMGYMPMMVAPARWKRDMGLTSEKADSLELARETFLEMEEQLKRAKDHNRAEALLLALWRANKLNLLED